MCVSVRACVRPQRGFIAFREAFRVAFLVLRKKNSGPFSRTKNRVPSHTVLLLSYYPSLSFILSLRQDPCCQASPWHSCFFSLLFISLPSLIPPLSASPPLLFANPPFNRISRWRSVSLDPLLPSIFAPHPLSPSY